MVRDGSLRLSRRGARLDAALDPDASFWAGAQVAVARVVIGGGGVGA
jgi:hypothetical protein